MLAAFDVDGVIDAFPTQFLSIMQALRSAGHEVWVLTGTTGDTATDEDLANKKSYLESLGCGDCWDKLVVVPQPHPENKASWIQENGIDILFDNSKHNAKAAKDLCPVLVLWQTREK
jgi:acid phosphatase class B